MAEIKTKPTSQSVAEFINTIEPEEKRRDGFALLEMFQKITGEKAVMWGSSIVGFGTYQYKSPSSKRAGDWLLVGFSPRKQNLTLYIMAGNTDSQELLGKLGKHKASGGCIYIKKLSDVDLMVLTALIEKSFHYMQQANH